MGPFWTERLSLCRTNRALPLFCLMDMPWHHTLHTASSPARFLCPPTAQGPRTREIWDQRLAPRGPRTAARDMFHTGGQARIRQKVGSLPRRLGFRASSKPRCEIGALQGSTAMPEAQRTSHSGKSACPVTHSLKDRDPDLSGNPRR